MKFYTFSLMILLVTHNAYAQKSPHSLTETLEWLKDKMENYGYVPENYCDLFACSVYGSPKENIEFLGSHSNTLKFEYDTINTLITIKLHFEMAYLDYGCNPPCGWRNDTINITYMLNVSDISSIEKRDIKQLLPLGCTINYNSYDGFVIFTKSNSVKRVISSAAKKNSKETKGKMVYGFEIFNPDFDITKGIVRAINYAKFLSPEKDTNKF